MKTVFSGIQPSGDLHIGNYIGAISQWVKGQDFTESIFCVVDLHAITVPQNPSAIKEKVLEVAALYLACGIDPRKSKIFIQSENPNHTELAWILNTITPFGQLERMTQFKEKSEKHEVNVGLFDYPVLMASDILLYQTDEVPVGEDQKQHIELTRDLAEKFNKKFGQTFKLPNSVIHKDTARIMSLQNPLSKMSKSDNDPLGTLNLLDTVEKIKEKIKKAVTDSNSSISKDNGGEAIANLLAIYSAFKDQSLDITYNELDGKSYGEFKGLLAELVVDKLKEIQGKYTQIRSDEKYLRRVLDEGKDYSINKSLKTLNKAKEQLGLM